MWEIFLLALAFCFGSFASLPGQTTTDNRHAGLNHQEINQFFDDCERSCITISTPGPIVIAHRRDSFPNVHVDRKRASDDRWIIILRDPLFFEHMDSEFVTYGNSYPAFESQKLGLIIDSISDFKGKIINVYGHAGSDEINQHQLSLDRARKVAGFLRDWGVEGEIVLWPMGSSKPNEEDRYQNFDGLHRRVEVILTDPHDEPYSR